MTLDTFKEFDRKISGKVAKTGDDQFETFMLMVQLFRWKPHLWKAEAKRLQLNGWNDLVEHKKPDWGITVNRFRTFDRGLERLKLVIKDPKHPNDEARQCGVAVVALFGHPRWTQPMVEGGVKYVRACHKKHGNNAKLTYQLVAKYSRETYPEVFKRKASKRCNCGPKLEHLQSELDKYKKLYRNTLTKHQKNKE